MSAARQTLPYGVAIASTAIALLLSLWIQLILPQTIGAFFYIAIAISASYGGVQPGMVAIALAVLTLDYFFFPPVRQIGFANLENILWLILFVFVSLIITLLSSNLRQSRQKVEQLNHQLAEDSAERLKTALNAAQMGMWDWNQITGEIHWSPEHEQLFGFPPGTFDGRYETFDACIHPDDRAGINQAIAHALQNRIPYYHEYRIIWPDGSIHWLEGRGKTFYSEAGEPVRMSGTILAIDQRKQVEIALQEKQIQIQRQLAEIETIYQSAPIGLNVLDTELRFVRINQKLAEMNGLSVEAHIGRTIRQLLPNLADTAERLLRSILETGEPLLNVEITGETSAQPGVQRTWIESFLPIKDGDRIIGINTVCEEITERKRAEAERMQLLQKEKNARAEVEKLLQQLEAERSRLEQILQQMPVGVSISQAPSGKLIFHNEEAVKLLRHPLFHSDNYPEYVQYGAIHPDEQPYQPHEYPIARSLLLGEAIEAEEMYYRRGDGTITLFSVSAAPILDREGQIIAAVSSFEDIRDRKRAEASLRQSEARLRLAQSASQSAVWDWDILSNTLTWSPEYYQLYGLDPSTEASYENWLSCVHPDDREKTHQQTWQAVKNPSSDLRVEFRSICSQEIRWFAGIGQVLRNETGEPIRMIGITIDITQQKQAEIALQQLNAQLEQRVIERTAELTIVNDRLQIELQERQQTEAILREAERRWRFLLDNVQLIVVGLDRSGCISYVNPFFLSLTGYIESEVLGKNWFENFLPASSQPMLQSVFSEILVHNTHPYYQNSIVTQSGEERYIGWNNTMLQDFDGNIIGTISIGEDITERQKIEAIKNEFIGIVSHELRTPLTSIQMSLGLLNSGVYAKKPEKSQRMIEIALVETNRLVNLVNDILDLERLESGRTILEKSACLVADLMQQAVDGVQAIAAQQNIILIVTPTDAQVWAAPDTIIQTLTNLLSNAIKFSPARSAIALRVHPQIDNVLFEVTDRGRGIPTDKLETIFGRFQQVDASDSREKGGTGLGLPICRSIIERHGGKIWAESTLGEGSTFFFTLPLPPERNDER